MLQLLSGGGPFMVVIGLASIAILALIIERTYVLWFRFGLNAEQFIGQIIGYLEEKKFSRAIEACNVEAGHPLAEVLKAGLLKANESDRDIQRALETAALKTIPVVSRRASYLAMLANISTLLGLLGTIVGLITAFEGVAQADIAAKQDILSKGISVAMLTTAFGLIAALPAIVSHSMIESRQNQLLSQIEASAADLFNYLSARNRRLADQR